VKGFL